MGLLNGDNVHVYENEIIKQYEGFIVNKACAKVNSMADKDRLDDLIQAGYIALWEAIKLWDSSRAKFHTFAVFYVNAKMLRKFSKIHIDTNTYEHEDRLCDQQVPIYERAELEDFDLSAIEMDVATMLMDGVPNWKVRKQLGISLEVFQNIKDSIKCKIRM
jgi:DNA-directed RNA polymerase specialized sigma24 family protein